MISKESRLYIDRLLGYLGKKDPLVVLRRTPQRIHLLIGSIPPKVLTAKSTPAAWSIAEIIAHLADTELVLGWRYRSIAERSGKPIQSFDQNIWCSNARYGSVPVKKSLLMFSVLRAMNIEFLAGLSRTKLSYYGMHEERGKETLRHIIRLEAGHDLNHLMQIEKIIRKFKTNGQNRITLVK
jgi:hypothetical protein